MGAPISDETSLSAWLGQNPDALGEGATFVVGLAGVLRLAPRRSEHLACAGANEVLAAGFSGTTHAYTKGITL
ncbi:MAG: hypothetical protein Q8N23_35890 [Archangium sp.]|nr:hypothetical protein [Archangium sp.]MDP3570484.1 hypothetical protein [Archangium sp.]